MGLCPGDVDTLATFRPMRLPVFPALLLSARVAGTVVLRFKVNERGRIDTLQIKVLSSTHELFTAAARAAMVHWRATPAWLDGRRVAQWSDVTFSFEFTCAKVSTPVENGTPSPVENGMGGGGRALGGFSLLTA
jgi:TonB family protein